MIKYNPKLWFKHIFQFHKSDTFRILWKELLLLGLITYGLAYFVLLFFESSKVFKDLERLVSLETSGQFTEEKSLIYKLEYN